MIRFMVVMVSIVFVIVGLRDHNWLEALLFGLSVAVGLTPEMLPMIMTVCLSKGALMMSRKKVIVKHLTRSRTSARWTSSAPTRPAR
jgi:P-type Mg2+ transporter